MRPCAPSDGTRRRLLAAGAGFVAWLVVRPAAAAPDDLHRRVVVYLVQHVLFDEEPGDLGVKGMRKLGRKIEHRCRRVG